tara:strand:+ start:5911 stop:6192 length:282 start_codon:yes stop_codon:yes gene_type:complete
MKYSNADGYGFWCNQRCADAKKAQGIPPLGSARAAKVFDAQGNLLLGEAASTSASQGDSSWSATATAGVAIASLLTIGVIAVLIIKAKKRKAS